MSFLLDTCVVSELIRPSPDPAVVSWVRDHDEQKLYLSVLTLGEIRKGIDKLPASKRRDVLEDWLKHDLTERFRGRILGIDQQIALTWGQNQAASEQSGRPMPVIDGLLAATAAASRATLVTRNVADFEGSSIEVVNPWI